MSDALQRRIGLGVKLLMDEASGSNYVELASVVDVIDLDGGSVDIADMSILSDLHKTKAAGQKDSGKCTFLIAYDPAGSTTAARINTARNLTGVTPPNFQISYPAAGTANAATQNFSGWVTKLGRQISKSKMIVAPIEVDISGAIV